MQENWFKLIFPSEPYIEVIPCMNDIGLIPFIYPFEPDIIVSLAYEITWKLFVHMSLQFNIKT